MNHYKILEKLLLPFECLDKIRVGSQYDGGYIVPLKAVKEADCVLSFGVSTNIDFEEMFSQYNPKSLILMFDPFIGVKEDFGRLIKRVLGYTQTIERKITLADNPDYTKNNHSLLEQVFRRGIHWSKFYKFISKNNIEFKKIGIRNYCDSNFINFSTLFSDPKVADNKSIILKIDIEGDEYTTFNDLTKHLKNISVILYEFHEVNKNVEKIIKIIQQLEADGFYLIHTHGNNSDILVDNTTIPNTLELSFCIKEYCNINKKDTQDYPVQGLDYPCNPQKIDYNLEFLKHLT
jgi:hypothetical protein